MKPYTYLIVGSGMTAAGDVAAFYWEHRYHKGIIYCLEHNRVRSVLLWNVWSKVNGFRQLLAEQTTVSLQVGQPLVQM